MKPTDEQLRDPKWWDENCRPESSAYHCNGCWHKRPTSQPTGKPEWHVVEAELHEGENCWYEAVVIGETLDGRRKVVQWVDDAMSTNSVDALPPNRIRHIKNQQEQEREELAKIIEAEGVTDEVDAHQVAIAVLQWIKERNQ